MVSAGEVAPWLYIVPTVFSIFMPVRDGLPSGVLLVCKCMLAKHPMAAASRLCLAVSHNDCHTCL